MYDNAEEEFSARAIAVRVAEEAPATVYTPPDDVITETIKPRRPLLTVGERRFVLGILPLLGVMAFAIGAVAGMLQSGDLAWRADSPLPVIVTRTETNVAPVLPAQTVDRLVEKRVPVPGPARVETRVQTRVETSVQTSSVLAPPPSVQLAPVPPGPSTRPTQSSAAETTTAPPVSPSVASARAGVQQVAPGTAEVVTTSTAPSVPPTSASASAPTSTTQRDVQKASTVVATSVEESSAIERTTATSADVTESSSADVTTSETAQTGDAP